MFQLPPYYSPTPKDLERLHREIATMGRAFKRGASKLKFTTAHKFKKKFPPRNTSVKWLVEQSRALHSVGWRCCNRLSRSGRLGRDQLRKLDALCLYRRGILLVLHRRKDSVGNECSLDRLRINPSAVKTIYHFVRGWGYRSHDWKRVWNAETQKIAHEIQPPLTPDEIYL